MKINYVFPGQQPGRAAWRGRGLTGLALLAPALGAACPWCRPKVQAAIHTPAYAPTVLVVLLPVAVLLALGLALYWAESLWPRRTASPPSPKTV